MRKQESAKHNSNMTTKEASQLQPKDRVEEIAVPTDIGRTGTVECVAGPMVRIVWTATQQQSIKNAFDPAAWVRMRKLPKPMPNPLP